MCLDPHKGNCVGRLCTLPIQGRFPVPLPVLKSRLKRVQTAVIVFGITVAVECIVVIKKMAVLVEQSFDFQNLFQLSECPSVSVMLPCIKTVLFRQSIYALDKPLIAADIRTWVYGAFPTDPADMKRKSGGKR